ncbi:MAG TPA: type VI secretion system protein TssL [Gammaproteobacteria bacterium]|nr:type VI secretion system protein TssL [Gammaproteobacteria bacterium]MEC8011694.1 flagellar motor protein MotB [Pseudomonadota bacterium]HBF08151.1 type VI secretion system protein TssL [Gammaproteobacteria bacterium]HCK94100.1 type VI secretion system protein TssL [Gammaproteobacteria bacterium]|tara:strand:- start:763 stop:1758 length:996 start_codon:yes stop_codon:yes gene_type:complete
MADSDDDECECPAGLPAWLATFADLMSLLMCFFVLLLSFSEMDVQKYKQVAGSMASAFGVQNLIKTKDIPKGTSIIAQEFSPGRPEPTPINEVRQFTTDVTKSELNVNCPTGETPTDESSGDRSEADVESSAQAVAQLGMIELQVEKAAMEVASALSKEVKNGQVEVETDGAKIVIRVKEHGSFASGSATMRPEFVPIMARIRDVLRGIRGVYTVEGHTDNIPINTPRFRSNWELSTSRAVSVLQELLVGGYLDERRFTVVGYGSTRPILPNSTPDNRSKNRRVEIIVEQGKEPNWEEFKVFESDEVQNVIDEIRDANGPPDFNFDEDEIF